MQPLYRNLIDEPTIPFHIIRKSSRRICQTAGGGTKDCHAPRSSSSETGYATVEAFGNAIITLKHEVKYCKICHNISDTETCCICSNPVRDASTICVVETIRDVMAVEATQQYKGLYHVLGGVISPMDGIGPSDLQIESLVERVKNNEVKEVILALSSTMEGDTTNFYIFRKLADTNVKLSVIARGISIGDELEYTDEVTLGRSIANRTLFTGTV